MKKLWVTVLAVVMIAGLTACGGSESAEAPAATTTAETEAAEAQAEEPAEETAAEGEFDEEQAALAQEFLDMSEAYDNVVERVNNCPEILAEQEVVDTMNELADEIIAADEYFADPATLTPEVMEELRGAIDAVYTFISTTEAALDEIEGAAAETEGGEVITVPVEIANETGVDIYGLALSPSASEDWGENLITEVIAAGESVEGELDFTADTLVWDILVEDGDGNQVTFMGVDFTNADAAGAKLVLSEENGEYFAEIVQ